MQDKFKRGLKEYEDREEMVTDEIRHKVYSDVLGPEKRNRVRGYGLGVQFSDVPGIVTEATGMCRDVLTLKAAWEQQKQAATEAQVEIEGLRLANTKLAEELRQEQAVTMEEHKKKMEDEFEKMKENMMNELSKLAQNPSSSDSARGLMENSVASFQKWLGRVDINSEDPIDGDDYVMVERENDGDYSPVLPAQLDLNIM